MLSVVDLGLGAALAAIAAIDLRSHRIPDALSLPLVAAGLVWSWIEGDPPWSANLVGALAGYLSLAGFGALYYRWRGREGLGLGDAKLFSAAGAWLGWQSLPAVLLAASLAGALFAVVTGAARADRAVAFGPWLALSFYAAWIWSRWAAAA